MTLDEILKHPNKDKYLSAELCHYCNIKTLFISSQHIYGVTKNFGKVYRCPNCFAYVGVHENTTRAKGTVAGPELRKLRIDAHNHFDVITKRGLMSRSKSYHWLSKQLNLHPDYTHIGNFDEKYCKMTIEKMKEFIHQANNASGGSDPLYLNLLNEHIKLDDFDFTESDLFQDPPMPPNKLKTPDFVANHPLFSKFLKDEL